MNDNLGLIILGSAKDLGERVLDELYAIRLPSEDKYKINITENTFNDGSSKIRINQSVRDRDLYILSDVQNNDCPYMSFGRVSYKNPDNHFNDIRRVISAISGHTDNYSVFMPFLIYSRQHSANNYESNDCADALRDLADDNVRKIITYDMHSTGVKHALVKTRTEMQNIFATNIIVKSFLEHEDIDLNDLLLVAPDEGAQKRTKYYVYIFRSQMGTCYKVRDYGNVQNGKEKILEHTYMGPNPTGKNVIIVDDMISSGGSIIDTAKILKEQGAKNIYFFTTFALFTEGIELFQKEYESKLFTRVYSTNLTATHKQAKSEEWFRTVDCAPQIARIIHNLNTHQSIKPITDIEPELLEEIRVRKLKR